MNDHRTALYIQYLAATENGIKLVFVDADFYDTYVGECIKEKLEDPHFGQHGQMKGRNFIPRLHTLDTWLPSHHDFACHGCGVRIDQHV
jgi:hypothetical protein